MILISSTKPIPNPFMRHSWNHYHCGLGKVSIWQWNLVRCIWFQNIMRQGPGWNDHNFLLHCYSAGTIHGGVPRCILLSQKFKSSGRVLNTLSVKYRVRTIMKIVQIFQILTGAAQIPDKSQTMDRQSRWRGNHCLRSGSIIRLSFINLSSSPPWSCCCVYLYQ